VAPAFPHPDGLEAAKACALPGRCVFCEEPTSGARYCFAGRQPRRGEAGYPCFRAFQRAYYRDVRALRAADRPRSAA
jgi:hypothetical protein